MMMEASGSRRRDSRGGNRISRSSRLSKPLSSLLVGLLCLGSIEATTEAINNRRIGEGGGREAVVHRELIAKDAALSKAACFGSYPRQLVVRKLQSGQSLTADGNLDEQAWTEIPWSEPFVDIEGDLALPPRLETKVKMRYDNTCLWIAAYMEEPQAWATLTENNTVVYQDNDFEVFIDPNGDTQYYKEVEVNALATVWNLLLVRPYINGGPAVCNGTDPKMCNANATAFGVPSWDMLKTGMKVGVQVNGTLNDPTKGSHDWTVEMCLPLADLAKYEDGVNVPPKEGDRWRINFSRVQYRVTEEKVDGKVVYRKNETSPPDNWVFQPVGVVNMHLPERWGYVYFSQKGVGEKNASTALDPEGPLGEEEDLNHQGPRDPLWPVREALAQVYEAEKIYDALYGQSLSYTSSLNSLVLNGHLSDHIAQGFCAGVPSLTVTKPVGNTTTAGFETQIKSVDVPGLVGHINQDRKIWFTGAPGDFGANGGRGGEASSEKGSGRGGKGRKKYRLRK